MAIIFSQFTNVLAKYFGEPREEFGASQNGSQLEEGREGTAEFITNEYVRNILQGTDASFGNAVVGFQKGILKSALFKAFNIGFNANSNIHFSNTVSTGLIGFWAGGILAFTIPPPTSIQVVSNVVTFPGSPQILRIRNTTDHREFANELVQMFRRHLISLKGITTSLVPTPTGAAVPTPFPWSSFG